MRFKDSRTHRFYPVAVLLLGVAASIGVALLVESTARSRDELRFAATVDGLRAALINWIDPHLALLRAGGAMFAAKDTVNARQFASFVQRLDLPARYPGIQGIGFTLRVSERSIDSLERAMRRAGDTSFRFYPRGTRSEYHSIIYLEPRDRRNLAAIGYDMFSNEARREAMTRSRDSGTATMSAPVRLRQEIDSNVQNGFLIYEPVYRGGTVPTSVEERRQKLLGFVYSPMRAGDLLTRVLRDEAQDLADYQVFDGPIPQPRWLLHDSRVLHPAERDRPRHVDTTHLTIAGRTWSVIVSSRPDFEVDSSAGSGVGVLIGGLVMTIVLFLLTRSESHARRQAEANARSVAESKEALRLSEERFRVIFDQAPVGIAQTDLEDRIILVNRKFCELIAGPRESLLGTNVRRLIHADDLEPTVQARHRLVSTGGDVQLQKRYVRSDGSVVWASTTLSLLRDSRGRPASILAIVEDVGERRRVSQELVAAKEAAESANRAKDHFLAVLSHELRTPLTPVIAALEAFADQDLPEDLRQLLAIVRRNIGLEARLIDDLLDLTRIVNGKLKLHLEPVDIHRVINDATEMVDELRNGSREVVRRFEATQPVVLADAARLQQVIWNLVKNATKFTPPGGRIELSTLNDDSNLLVSVSDSGAGIEPEVLPKIFNAFEQGEAGRERRHGGLGLGLTISQMLVEMHGGHISAASEGPGRGATFSIELPGAFAGETATPSTFRHGLRTEDGVGTRVLLVDDHADTRHVIELLLRQLGYVVRTAATVKEALQHARQQEFDVIVSDIGLPDGDGYSLMRTLRKEIDTPAVALSGYGMDEDVRRSREAGFNEHLTKPVDIRRLNDVINALLHRHDGL